MVFLHEIESCIVFNTAYEEGFFVCFFKVYWNKYPFFVVGFTAFFMWVLYMNNISRKQLVTNSFPKTKLLFHHFFLFCYLKSSYISSLCSCYKKVVCYGSFNSLKYYSQNVSAEWNYFFSYVWLFCHLFFLCCYVYSVGIFSWFLSLLSL